MYFADLPSRVLDRTCRDGEVLIFWEMRVVKAILQALEEDRDVSDQEFDQIFPESIRQVSEIHWTSVEVARKAAQLLVVDGNTRVLDVGSGCGKFCFVGSLTTRGQFYGIERRLHLSQLSRRIADAYEMKRIEFIEGDIRSIDWSQFQSFYLYNPFVENIYADDIQIDQSIDFSERSYTDLVHWVQQRLHSLPPGTRVATYHGFGGDMPPRIPPRCGGVWRWRFPTFVD